MEWQDPPEEEEVIYIGQSIKFRDGENGVLEGTVNGPIMEHEDAYFVPIWAQRPGRAPNTIIVHSSNIVP